MPHIAAPPFLTDDVLANNFQNLKDHVQSVDFNRWLSPRAFYVVGGAGVIEGAYASSAYWNLPVGVDGVLTAQHYLPAYWVNGKLSVKVFYSGTASSTAVFSMTLRLTGWKENTTALTATTGDVTSVENSTPAGPATLAFLESYTMLEANWLALTSVYPYISIRVLRNGTAGADKYAGDIRFLGALLTFHPTRR